VTYDEVVERIVQVIEAVGIAVLILGGLAAAVSWLQDIVSEEQRSGAYPRLRRKLARVILIGLEILLLADIIRTIVVSATVESVVILGLIVVIRILLSFSLEVEIDGAWPWNRWRTDGATPPSDPL
jgi:uncharacterized membrane protein